MTDEISIHQLIRRVGGNYPLTRLLQQRVAQLMRGARPLIDPPGRTPFETALQEVAEGRAEIQWEEISSGEAKK